MFPKDIKSSQVLNWTLRKGVKTVSLGSLVTGIFYLAHRVFLNIIWIFISFGEPHNLHPLSCLNTQPPTLVLPLSGPQYLARGLIRNWPCFCSQRFVSSARLELKTFWKGQFDSLLYFLKENLKIDYWNTASLSIPLSSSLTPSLSPFLSVPTWVMFIFAHKDLG